MLSTFEEALVLLRNHDEWWDICMNGGEPIFQFFNKEFVDALAHYLKERGQTLEVGAGNGLLSEELRKRRINIIATDNGDERITTVAPVELLDYHEAIRHFRPDIVLCSWMPYKEDWTPVFRKFKCIREYILTGDSRACGSNKTWGHQPSFEQIRLTDIDKWALCRTDYPGQRHHSTVISFRRYK